MMAGFRFIFSKNLVALRLPVFAVELGHRVVSWDSGPIHLWTGLRVYAGGKREEKRQEHIWKWVNNKLNPVPLPFQDPIRRLKRLLFLGKRLAV